MFKQIVSCSLYVFRTRFPDGARLPLPLRRRHADDDHLRHQRHSRLPHRLGGHTRPPLPIDECHQRHQWADRFGWFVPDGWWYGSTHSSTGEMNIYYFIYIIRLVILSVNV